MKHTKQLFMILLIVFLLVGLGTIAAADNNKTDTAQSTEITKTSTTNKDTMNINKVSTTTKDTKTKQRT